jgi:GPH family glycoside/pentoside/hexuronide:cation symporter
MKNPVGMKNPGRIPAMTKISFGVADFGISVLVASMQFYMLFYYTDVVKIDPGIAGTAMLVGKIAWDMINDLIFGYVSDRTKSRWGRRRPYLIFCSIPLGLSYWLLFSLPVGMSNLTAFFAVLGSFLVYDTFLTMVQNSYYAMTAELTLDYNERTGLSTVRMVFNAVGYIFGAAMTTVLAAMLQGPLDTDPRGAWSAVGLIFGVLAAVTSLVTGLTVTMKPAIEPAPEQIPKFREILSVFRNKPFVKYTIIQTLVSIIFTFETTMLPYFVIYQLKMNDQLSLIMMLLLVVLTLFIYPCSKIVGRLGKAKTYAYGMALAGVAMVIAFFLPVGSSPLIYGIMVLAGIGLSSQWVCPHSMMPDVVEYDELISGGRREGVYYGMNGLITKIANALGMLFCGWGLKWSGYVEGAEQTPTALLGIRLLFALVPVLMLFICCPLLFRYPVTRESHAAVVAELEARRQERG